MARAALVHKFAFAASSFGNATYLTALGAYAMFFYTDVALLGVGLAGLARGIGRIFDAMNDPVIGYLSDKTRTRWGRRRPWIAAAALPCGLAFIYLFRPPTTTDQLTLFIYFLVMSLTLDLFMTMIQIPHLALGAELSSDYYERTQIFALSTFFSNLGRICGGFLPFAVAYFAEVKTGYAQTAVFFAGAAISMTLLNLFVPDRLHTVREASLGFGDFWQGYRICLRNRAFRILLLTFLAMSLGGGVSQAVGIYALVYWLGFTPRDVGLVLPVFLGASCLALPFWTWLSGRIGKDVTFKFLLTYEICTCSGAYFLIPSQPVVYAFMCVAGFGAAGFVVATSLLVDILDSDELETGAQRAGVFLGFWTLVTKSAAAAGPALVGWILATAGYVPNVAQAPDVVETMRWLYGPLPTLFFIFGYLLFRDFPLTRERLGEIQAKLAYRRLPVEEV